MYRCLIVDESTVTSEGKRKRVARGRVGVGVLICRASSSLPVPVGGRLG